MFIAGLAAETPQYVCICSELGRRFSIESDPKSTSTAGKIDIYVDGDIRWVIELLLAEDRISENLSRCSLVGKYGVQNIISKVKLDQKKMTMVPVFPPDYFISCTVLVAMIVDTEGKRSKEVLSPYLQSWHSNFFCGLE
jgi:hypothetical protein